MVAKIYLVASAVVLFTLFNETDAYWTVRERNIPRKDNKFWAELTNIEFDGNDSSQIKCRVNTNPYQDKTSIIYANSTSYHGCEKDNKVSLHGSNRVLNHLEVINSGEILNCVLAEKTSSYKEYVCGNAVPPFKGTSSSSHSTTTPSSTKGNNIISTTTVTYFPSTSNSVPCTTGYRGKRNGGGPNGACCSHSNDCTDTCVQGVCGITP